ncbi:MAG TPA: response regulator [Vicinamibacterales bacterium]|jgi:CheY-like chemotaxis protein|nr:response regulator [Vicinamibacterales bacterium]
MTTEHGPLILVVDDYQDAREMYAEYLQYSGFRVAEAKNGNEAVAQARSLRPDLILMDLSLPGMDGWEATRVLKADEATKHIPIVALTGHALAGASEGARKAGCDSFVTKPCLPDDLVVEVKRMLNAIKQG